MTEGHTGGMFALVPSNPDALTVDGGDPAEQMHLTLAYLGDDLTGLDPQTVKALQDDAAALAQSYAPINGRIMGHAHWNMDGGPDGDKEPCAVYQIEGNDLIQQLHDAAVHSGGTHLGADFPAQHNPFMAHVTAGYNLDPGALSATGPVTFDTLRLAIADQDFDYPLTGSEEQQMTAAVTEAPADVPVPQLDESNGVPLNFPVIMVEGYPTSDGRFIQPGSLSHRALPLPVLAQTSNPVGGDGHDGAEVVGRLDTLERVPGPQVMNKETGEPFPEGTFVWRGSGFGDPNAHGIQLAQKGYLTGNSADLSEVEADYDYGIDDQADEGEKLLQMLNADAPQITITSGKIAATTLVPIPAFAESYVEVGGQAMTPNAETAGLAASAMFRSSELGDECLLCAAGVAESWLDDWAITADERKKAAKAGEAMPDGSYPIRNADDLDKAIRAVGRGGAEHDAIRRHIMKRAKALGLESRIPDGWQANGSLKASASPLFPPMDAFTDPQLNGPTPLTVEEADGGRLRVYGHLATWGTCHTSFAGQCVTPPRSASDYGYFNVGAVRVMDLASQQAREVSVGHITMGEGGHAGTQLSAADAAAFYDNVNTVVADVTAGEDAHGVWLAGLVRASATPEQVEALRAAALSGDWRRINGSLELVAALAVNTPGFPIPRARVAAGAPLALVAAGAVPNPKGKTVTTPAPAAKPAPAKPDAAPAGGKLSPDQEAFAQRVAELVTQKIQDIEQQEEEKEGTKVAAQMQDELALRSRAARATFAIA